MEIIRDMQGPQEGVTSFISSGARWVIRVSVFQKREDK